MIHENSRDSYEIEKARGNTESYRRKIYDALVASAEPMTDRQLTEAVGATDFNNTRPEIVRLIEDGLIEEQPDKVICETTKRKVRTTKPTGKPYHAREKGRRKKTPDTSNEYALDWWEGLPKDLPALVDSIIETHDARSVHVEKLRKIRNQLNVHQDEEGRPNSWIRQIAETHLKNLNNTK